MTNEKQPYNATAKQLKLIRKIEKLMHVRFTGNTERHAASFIAEHRDAYNAKREYNFMMNNP